MYKIVHFYITFFVHSYIIINNGIFDYDKLDKILNDKYKLKIVDRKTSQMIKL